MITGSGGREKLRMDIGEQREDEPSPGTITFHVRVMSGTIIYHECDHRPHIGFGE